MPAIAVMAIEPAITVSNSSVPGRSVSRRRKDATATAPTPRRTIRYAAVCTQSAKPSSTRGFWRSAANDLPRIVPNVSGRSGMIPGRDAGVQAG